MTTPELRSKHGPYNMKELLKVACGSIWQEDGHWYTDELLAEQEDELRNMSLMGQGVPINIEGEIG